MIWFVQTYEKRVERVLEDISDLRVDMAREKEALTARVSEIHQANDALSSALKFA